MPAQPQNDQNEPVNNVSGQDSVKPSQPPTNNVGLDSGSSDPYSTLRAQKVSTTSDSVMTESKRNEMGQYTGVDNKSASAQTPRNETGDEVSNVNDNNTSASNSTITMPAANGKSNMGTNDRSNMGVDQNINKVATNKDMLDVGQENNTETTQPEPPNTAPTNINSDPASKTVSPDNQEKNVKEDNKQVDFKGPAIPKSDPPKVNDSTQNSDGQNTQQVQAANMDNNGPTINSTTTLADVLAGMGVLERDKADEVKLSEVKTGNSQEEILKAQNLTSDEEISKAKAKLYNVPYIDLSTVPVDPESINLIPQQVAEKFKIFPVSKDASKQELIVAMADPLNLTAIEFLEQRTGLTVKPRAADPVQIENLITAGYTTSLAKEVSEALKDVSQERRKVRTLDAGRTGLIREEKVAEVVTHILGFAVKSRASDIHIEPQEHATRVRYRIDGILQEKLTIPKELHDALVSRIKILSGMKIDEKRVPQDGRFNFKSDTQEVDLRVSTLPTAWGEKIVMRLLKKSGGIPELPELGLRGRALKNLQEAILRPHGIILITGPTGSGKTTTLYSIIQKINTPKVNIMTLEDPVEYKIHGVNQVQVNPGAGLTFASGMRSFLRQDPNIILVGEIRDEETANLAIQASLTGHLVFSTLHTNSAAGALPRLLDMGAEPYLLASSITAIVGQRVVRKIHEPCKTGYVPEQKVIDDVKKVLGNLWKQKPGEVEFYKGQGDQDCNNSGYHGRVGIFEVLPVSEKISRLILEQAPSSDIDKQAREEGMVTMKQDGYLKVVEGITTIEEVLRVAQE